MGTPQFAVQSLKQLINNNYNIVAVVTTPDKPVGRHQDTLQQSPVKQYALQNNLPILQPQKLTDPTFLNQLQTYQADLQIVVAFRMLPTQVWNMPPMGTINLHASLLPQYRGAAPINWAIINGDPQTGVTTFYINREIDTGNIIKQQTTPIHPTDNAQTLHDRLMNIGAQLLLQTVDDIITQNIHTIPQQQIKTIQPLQPAPKIYKETCRIDWQAKTPEQINNFVRGLSPYPTAWTQMKTNNGRLYTLKIYSTTPTPTQTTQTPGTILTDGKTYLKVALNGGYITINELQLSGKRRMTTTEFLRGFRTEQTLTMI